MQNEALSYIDMGADFYLRVMGDAEHMELRDNGLYETMQSRGDINNLASVYNMRLEGLSSDALVDVIDEIRELRMHTWWPLSASDRVLLAIHGKIPAYTPDDFEIYGIMPPGELPEYAATPAHVKIERVETLGNFAVWCDLDNNTEHHGTVIFHAQNHMHLIESGKLTAFLGLVDGVHVATCGILNNNGIASLEFVSTLPDFRKRDLAAALCQNALRYTFSRGTKVVTTRAIGSGRTLCKALGFRIITTE